MGGGGGGQGTVGAVEGARWRGVAHGAALGVEKHPSWSKAACPSKMGRSWNGGHLLFVVKGSGRSICSGVFGYEKVNIPFRGSDLTLKFLV